MTSRPPLLTSGGRFCGCRYQQRATSRRVTLLFSPETRPFATATFDGLSWRSHAPIAAARAASMRDAAATAPPPITIDREPQVAVEYGVFNVSPCITLM